MSSNERIYITASFASELTSKITIDGITYIVNTEEKSRKYAKASCRVYHNGKIVYSRDADYSHLIGKRNFADKQKDLFDKLHKSVINEFPSHVAGKQKKKSEFLQEAKILLRDSKPAKAMNVLKKGLDSFPGDPFMLSYYGCLCSVFAKKHKEGIKMCRDAISKLKNVVPFGNEFFFPSFYLNLGRAYLGANKKKEAIRAFELGLRSDTEDDELLGELISLGVRRRPPIPFLRRTNPLNKYTGKLIRKSSKV